MSGNPLLVDGELAAFGVVADEDRRAVRRLHAEQVVEVRLVRRVDDVELRILQIQPRDVAGVVVVAENRRGAQAQEPGERRIVGQVRGLAQRRGGGTCELDEPAVVPLAGEVGAAWPRSRHDGVRVVDGLLSRRVSGDVRLDLRARQAGGVERAARRHRRGADERLVAVDEIEAASVDEEVVPQVLRERRLVGFERVVEGECLGIALAPVHALELAARDDELLDHVALALAQARRVVRHLHRLEPREPLREVGCHGVEGRGDIDFRLREARGRQHQNRNSNCAFHARNSVMKNPAAHARARV